MFDKDLEFWRDFGFEAHFSKETPHNLEAPVPDGYVGFLGRGSEASEALWSGLQKIGLPPNFKVQIDKNDLLIVFALGEDVFLDALHAHFDKNVRIIEPGGIIPLPMGRSFDAESIECESLNDVAELWTVNAYLEEEPSSGNPLDKHSVRGQGEDLVANAVMSLPLLGQVILFAQMTLLYGTPNAGKTVLILALLCRAIQEGRLKGQQVYYVNADDNSQGAAEKVTLLDAIGAHTLLPGHNGFTMEKLEPLLLQVVAEQKAKGCVIVVDTLKKAIDIMNKSDSTRFAKAARAFVQAGGTFIALAHTNKNPGPNGKLSYAGTADFHQDADACLYLQRLGETPSGEEVLVQFEVFKQRGPNRNETYAYLAGPDVSYTDRLDSVRLVGADETETAARQASLDADADVIEGIREAIQDGNVKKMDLERAVRVALGVSRSRFAEVLERYDGELWSHRIRERGAKVYRLHGD